ncbi:hypothetical protein LXL04_029468 [Taraxacum kok-saghyz]
MKYANFIVNVKYANVIVNVKYANFIVNLKYANFIMNLKYANFIVNLKYANFIVNLKYANFIVNLKYAQSSCPKIISFRRERKNEINDVKKWVVDVWMMKYSGKKVTEVMAQFGGRSLGSEISFLGYIFCNSSFNLLPAYHYATGTVPPPSPPLQPPLRLWGVNVGIYSAPTGFFMRYELAKALATTTLASSLATCCGAVCPCSPCLSELSLNSTPRSLTDKHYALHNPPSSCLKLDQIMIECAAKIWTTRGMFSWYKKGGFRTAKSRKHKGKKEDGNWKNQEKTLTIENRKSKRKLQYVSNLSSKKETSIPINPINERNQKKIGGDGGEQSEYRLGFEWKQMISRDITAGDKGALAVSNGCGARSALAKQKALADCSETVDVAILYLSNFSLHDLVRRCANLDLAIRVTVSCILIKHEHDTDQTRTRHEFTRINTNKQYHFLS